MMHDANSGLVTTPDCAPQPDVEAGSPPVLPVCVSIARFRLGGTAGCKKKGNHGNGSKWGTNAKKGVGLKKPTP